MQGLKLSVEFHQLLIDFGLFIYYIPCQKVSVWFHILLVLEVFDIGLLFVCCFHQRSKPS